MSESPLRIGLVGYGLAGRVFHTPLYDAAGVSLVAVASSDGAKVHADHPDVRVHATVTELVNDTDVELVVLASPSFTHADFMIEAMEAGKHVLTDKPFCATVSEADRVIDVARQTGRVVSCYQNRRLDSDFLTLKELIDRGELGDVVHYQAYFNRYNPVVKERWQEENIPGVGIHYDLGAHLIDQALVLFGLPDWVQGDVQKQREGSRIIDNFHLLMGQGNRRIELSAGMLIANHSLRYQIHGTKGSWVKHHLDPQEEHARYLGILPTDDRYGYEDPSRYGEITTMVDGQAITKLTPSQRGDWPRFYRELADAIRKSTQPDVTAEQARDTIRVIQAMVKSSETGRRIIFT